MNNIKINPIKRLKGSFSLKGDKSVSHRAIMAASLAEGRSRVKNFLRSDDCIWTVKAFEELGIDIKISKDEAIVEGKGLKGLRRPSGEIYLGNSGTSMRLIAGIAAGQDFDSILTGDESLSNRPMHRVIEPLRLMGAHIQARDDNFAPLVIKKARLKAINYKTNIPSAQVKSAVILAGLYADGVTQIEEPAKSRDHTERMLSLFGAKLRIDELKVIVYDNQRLKAQTLTIPGDISGAAFFVTGASILPGSELVIKNLLYNRTRFGFIDVLTQMGADISIEKKHFIGYEDLCDIVTRSSRLKAISITKERIPSMIDELPILMVAAVFAEGQTTIKGAGELRVKETDRIRSMTTALKSMGAEISVDGDDILIKGTGALTARRVSSYGDHRTAMSLVIAALRAKGETEVMDIDCIDTSFPDFFQVLDSVSVKR